MTRPLRWWLSGVVVLPVLAVAGVAALLCRDLHVPEWVAQQGRRARFVYRWGFFAAVLGGHFVVDWMREASWVRV